MKLVEIRVSAIRTSFDVLQDRGGSSGFELSYQLEFRSLSMGGVIGQIWRWHEPLRTRILGA